MQLRYITKSLLQNLFLIIVHSPKSIPIVAEKNADTGTQSTYIFYTFAKVILYGSIAFYYVNIVFIFHTDFIIHCNVFNFRYDKENIGIDPKEDKSKAWCGTIIPLHEQIGKLCILSLFLSVCFGKMLLYIHQTWQACIDHNK